MFRKFKRGIASTKMDGKKNKSNIPQEDVTLITNGKSLQLSTDKTTKEKMSNLKRNNSFNEFFSKSIDQDEKLVIKKLKTLRNEKFRVFIIKTKEILKEVKNDLFNTDIDKKVKFKLQNTL